jgi:hypothetical protein
MIYDVKCKKCGEKQEIVRTVADRDKDLPVCCGETTRRIISLKQNIVPDLEPYVEENLGEKPVYIKSKQHRKEVMRKEGVYEKYGKGWI